MVLQLHVCSTTVTPRGQAREPELLFSEWLFEFWIRFQWNSIFAKVSFQMLLFNPSSILKFLLSLKNVVNHCEHLMYIKWLQTTYILIRTISLHIEFTCPVKGFCWSIATKPQQCSTRGLIFLNWGLLCLFASRGGFTLKSWSKQLSAQFSTCEYCIEFKTNSLLY